MVLTKQIGKDGPQVTAIGFGAMSLGGAYGPDMKETLEDKLSVLDRAHEIGERFWDTADVYRDSEDIIGQWFKKTGKRSDIFLATKFGLDYSTGAQVEKSDPEYVKHACATSLKRLGIETIDLYYCHRVDGKTPIEKTVEAMVELKNEGKIKFLGLSEVSASTIRRAHAVHPISAVQLEYSPFCLEIESPKTDILKTCRELGISIVAYSPIGRGLLTGQIKSFDDLEESDIRRLTPKYSRENFPKILDLVAKMETVAEKYQCTVGQVGLAWLLAQGDDIIPIPGTKTIKYLEENTNAMKIELNEDDVKELRRYAEETELIGDRYPTMFMGPIFGETPPL